jgi:hypothetical protein
MASPLERMLRQVERQRAVRAEDAEAELLESQSSARRRVCRRDCSRSKGQVRRLLDSNLFIRGPASLAEPGSIRFDALEQPHRGEQLEAPRLASELPQSR